MSINKITLEDIDIFKAYETLDHYQDIATHSAIYPGQGTPLGLAYVALKLNGEAGEFAEHVGKAMRDDGLTPLDSKGGKVARLDQKLTKERRNLLIKEIGDILWYCSAACNELGISFSYAALENLLKLKDRSERDKLQGSGDNR